MQEIQKNNHLNNFDYQEIDLRELFSVLWQEKRIVIYITTPLLILGLIYSLILPNLYKSSAILSPTDSTSSISKSLQNYAGLAGFAGMSLPSVSQDNNAVKAIKKLNSLSFFEDKILPNIFLPDLMAFDSWNHQTNTINYDESVYNDLTNSWVRDYSYPQKKIPSAQESFEIFITKHLTISEDKKTGFITLSVKHQSPFVAKKWIELMINEINTFYRQKDKLDSEQVVSYLTKQIVITNLSEVKQAITKIIQDETRKLALIEAKEYYVFDYIDPPAIMEKKYEPQRVLICFLSAILGSILSIIYILTKYYISRESSSLATNSN